MASGKGNQNYTGDTKTSEPSGAGAAPGGADTPGGAAGSNGDPGNTPGRSVTADRFVVHMPGSLSSAAGEQKVDDLFRQFFGAKKLKPIEMVEKMTQRAQAKKVEGRAVQQIEFTPRPLGGGSSGPVSGQSVAQTSLSERAHAALADAEKRLEALKPMKTPDDPENLDALRAVTLTTYKRLVGELSFGGGLRGTRVQRHFDVLIGVQPAERPIDLQVGSFLKRIEDAFSLKTGAEVNTTEDSVNLANFRIVKENLFDIYRGWLGFQTEVEKDFSELSSKLSRKLAVLDDEVTDVETAMDAAGFDVNDRESEVIESDQTTPKITIGGLFLWIREFASEEAPELIEGGGALGIEAVIPTLVELESLVGKLVTSPPIDENNINGTLGSLKSQLSKAIGLAKTITGPQ